MPLALFLGAVAFGFNGQIYTYLHWAKAAATYHLGSGPSATPLAYGMLASDLYDGRANGEAITARPVGKGTIVPMACL